LHVYIDETLNLSLPFVTTITVQLFIGSKYCLSYRANLVEESVVASMLLFETEEYLTCAYVHIFR